MLKFKIKEGELPLIIKLLVVKFQLIQTLKVIVVLCDDNYNAEIRCLLKNEKPQVQKIAT